LAIALIMCCIALFVSPYNTYAFTNSNINDAKDVGDIMLKDYATRKDGNVFNAEILAVLYEQITGAKGATLDNVSAKIDGANSYGGQNIYNSNDIRDANKAINNNAGKDIILTMGGMQWTVTSLVKVGSDVIATLWLTTSSYTHAWNSWSLNATNLTYPCNVYGTSYIRAEGLNIGSGYVAAQGASSLTPVNQSAAHPYAKFTMSSVTGSVTNFIVKPSQVAYQGVENQYPNSTIGRIGYTLPNEAYGTPTGSTHWYSNGSTIDMSTLSSKAGYTNWSNDLIWLPSLTETGYSSSVYGIWGLSDNQRSNSTYYSWLRSGHNNRAHNAYTLAAAGSSCSDDTVTSAYAVRPALHLNLSAAGASSAKLLTNPTDFNVT
ncbi:MAG: hypothetical protein K2I79_00830, partial [Clostridia bacterium]|nr:hypothetical protein [Clostridia bacterium]